MMKVLGEKETVLSQFCFVIVLDFAFLCYFLLLLRILSSAIMLLFIHPISQNHSFSLSLLFLKIITIIIPFLLLFYSFLQGMYQMHYNYQVRPVNCDECEGEGILYQIAHGQLVKKSLCPPELRTKESMYPKDDDAEFQAKVKELANSCGVHKGEADGSGSSSSTNLDMSKDQEFAPPPLF
jgi:hypothetical protein